MLEAADRQTRSLYWLVIFAALPVALLLNIARLVALWAERRPAEWSQIALSIASSLAWVAVAPIIIAAAHRFPLTSRLWRRNLVTLAALCAILAVVAEALYVAGLAIGRQIVAPGDEFEFFEALRTSVSQGGLTVNVMLFAGTVAATYALDTFQRKRARERQALHLEARLAETQLQLLRMQIHPHFLFNALNAVAALVDDDPDAADRMLSRLIDFFEFTAENAGKQEVTLEHELAFLRSYVEIEQTRFGDRLDVRFDFDPVTLPLYVPGLILQPLVENAVRHGIAPRAQQGSIFVRTRMELGKLSIVIEDDGIGMTHSNGRHGIGLGNTKKRLEHLYGAEQKLEIGAREGGGTRVSILLPARRTPALGQLKRRIA